MIRRIVVDTNVLIGFLGGKEAFSEAIENAEAVVLHPVVYGEYLAGVDESTEIGRLLRRQLDEFASSPPVILAEVTAETAVFYSKIHRFLKRSGKMIPQNDIWIAATALENGYSIATLDSHFDLIPTLSLCHSGS